MQIYYVIVYYHAKGRARILLRSPEGIVPEHIPEENVPYDNAFRVGTLFISAVTICWKQQGT